MRWKDEQTKQCCFEELLEEKEKFKKKHGLTANEIFILIDQMGKGNPKAIADFQWIEAVERLYYRRKQAIEDNLALENVDFDISFSTIGSLPYSIKEMLNLNFNNNGEIDHLLIVEFLYDVKGSDKGNEWLVLHNPTNTKISLLGWRIQTAGKSFSDKAILNGFVEPKQFFTIVGNNYPNKEKHDFIADLEIQNGGTETDGIRILNNNGLVIDTVLYDMNNANTLFDDTNQIGTNFAPDVTGSSLKRKKDSKGKYIDTNFAAKDWEENVNPNIEIYKN